MSNPNSIVQFKHLEAAVDVAKQYTDNTVATISTGGGSGATYSTATTTTSGLMSASDKSKLDNLASITTAGDNITIQGGTIKAAGGGGGTYSNATTTQAGLMSAEDKQRLDAVFQSSTEFADTVLAGLSGIYFPSAASVQDILTYPDGFGCLDNKYLKIVEGTDFNAYEANPTFLGSSNSYSYDGNTIYFHGNGAISLVADTSTITNRFTTVKVNENTALAVYAKESTSSAGVTRTASIMAKPVFMSKNGNDPTTNTAVAIITVASYSNTTGFQMSDTIWEASRSIYNSDNVMFYLEREASASSRVLYYRSVYQSSSTAFSGATAIKTIGTQYDDDALAGKTGTEANRYFNRLKPTVEKSETNARLVIEQVPKKWNTLPFIHVTQTIYNSSGKATGATYKLIAHHGMSSSDTVEIPLKSTGTAPESLANKWFEDYGYIAGCWLNKQRTTCYVITLATTDYISEDTPNLIKTLFDMSAKIFIFDFKTPSIILTDYKLSDIIDELLL